MASFNALHVNLSNRVDGQACNFSLCAIPDRAAPNPAVRVNSEREFLMHKLKPIRALTLAAAALGLAFASAAQTVPATVPASGAIPAAQLVGYDDFRGATLSPDGRFIAGILRDAQGDVVIVHEFATKKSTPIQRARADQNLFINFVQFKGNDRLIYSLVQKFDIVQGKGRSRSQAKDKDLQDAFSYASRVLSSDIDGKNLIALYDPQGGQGFPLWVSARIVDTLPADKDNVLLQVPTSSGTIMRKVNVRTGKFSEIEKGGVNTQGWVIDSNLVAVLREDSIAGGRGTAWSRRAPGTKDWIEIARFLGENRANGAPEFQALARGPRPGTAIVTARPNGRDTNGLYVYDAATGQFAETIAENDTWDVFQAVFNRDRTNLLASCYNAYMYECEPKDPAFQSAYVKLLKAVGTENQVEIIDGEYDRSVLAYVSGPRELGAYYVFDVKANALNLFQKSRPKVPAAKLPTQKVVKYKSTDGTDLWGYLWLPPGATDATRNLPMVVVPHGGPEARDTWGFDPFASSLATAGYAVFQPNFRGGAGMGRKFVEAGHGQWGQRIQQDIRDGAQSLIASGVADKSRVCVMGWSHGGYVAFTAAYQDADIYKCSIAGAGVSDLKRMQDWVRENQGGTTSISYKYWAGAIGDPSKDSDKLIKHSAYRNVDKIAMPMFIIHGMKDNTVPVEQSEIMIAALKKAGKPHESLIVPKMDHFFSPQQGAQWDEILTKSRAFLNKHIGPGWKAPA
jgi:dipeptidyl aminopeptidase/acylaminoacyl peptidase